MLRRIFVLKGKLLDKRDNCAKSFTIFAPNQIFQQRLNQER
jgi:hypothetical protein